MKEIDNNLDGILDNLDRDEKQMLRKETQGERKVNKERQEVQYYFLKVLQDNCRIRKLSCKYQRAMYDGAKEISDFEKNLSEIDPDEGND